MALSLSFSIREMGLISIIALILVFLGIQCYVFHVSEIDDMPKLQSQEHWCPIWLPDLAFSVLFSCEADSQGNSGFCVLHSALKSYLVTSCSEDLLGIQQVLIFEQ